MLNLITIKNFNALTHMEKTGDPRIYWSKRLSKPWKDHRKHDNKANIISKNADQGPFYPWTTFKLASFILQYAQALLKAGIVKNSDNLHREIFVLIDVNRLVYIAALAREDH